MDIPTKYQYLNQLAMGVQVISHDMKYLFLNETLLLELDQSQEEMLGRYIWEKYPGVEKTDVYRKIQDCLHTGEEKNLINEFYFKDNKRTFYEVKIQKVHDGAIIFTSDVTDSKYGEKLLQESNELLEQRVIEKTAELGEANRELQREIESRKSLESQLKLFKQAFYNSINGEFVLGLDQKITDVNQALLDLFGYTKDQTIGKTLRLFLLPDDSLSLENKVFSDIYEVGYWDSEMQLVKSNGDIFPALLTTYIVYSSSGEPAALQGVIKDLTSLKNIERQLRQAQKMEAIGELAGGIAHEFNNLLVPIMTHAEMLLTTSTDEKAKSRLGKIMDSSERASKIVKSMLAFSRNSQEPTDNIDLSEIAGKAISFIEPSLPKNIKILKHFDSDIPHIKAVSTDLQQALMNLVLNATHAMPDGGEITIKLSCKPLEKADGEHSESDAEDYVDLEVSDNGQGIAPDIIDKVFDPFFTTKEVGSGTGLGLSVVQGVVEQHAGHITVESKLGIGTTFHLYFPISIDLTPSTPISTSSAKPISGIGRILLVDDEPMIVETLHEGLEMLGYQVTSFLDCQQALTEFTNNKNAFDLVLTDYSMPKMKGDEFAKRIKEQRPDIKILLMTGFGKLEPEEMMKECGINQTVFKPFKISDASKIIKDLLA